MQVTVSIAFGEGDDTSLTNDQIAAAILKALKGDPDKDYVTVTTTVPPGVVGTPPVAP